MKNIIKLTLVSLTLGLFITSCDTTQSPELPRNAKPAVNVDTPTVQVSENGSATITISTNTVSPKPLIFKLVQVGGNAIDGEDFSFNSPQEIADGVSHYSALDYGPIGAKVVIPAYANSGSITIYGMTDFVVDNKKATFELRAMESMNGVTTSKNTVAVTVADYTEDDLTIKLGWTVSDGAVDDTGAPIDACAQDLDLYLGVAGNPDVAHSWNDCPEAVVLHASDADGVYFIHVDYWAPSDVTISTTDPLTYDTTFFLTVGQVGISSQVINGTSSSSQYLNWSGYGNFGGNGYHPNVIQITKTGTNYAIQ